MSNASDTIARLLDRDAFSKWLGLEIVNVSEKSVSVSMMVRSDMMNGHQTLHGGVLFAFADSAFAFVVNSSGTLTVAVNCTISFPVAVHLGDTLTAVAVEESSTRKLAFCSVTIRNQEEQVVAQFRGTAYRTSRSL